jgi:hypothetical protein
MKIKQVWAFLAIVGYESMLILLPVKIWYWIEWIKHPDELVRSDRPNLSTRQV